MRFRFILMFSSNWNIVGKSSFCRQWTVVSILPTPGARTEVCTAHDRKESTSSKTSQGLTRTLLWCWICAGVIIFFSKEVFCLVCCYWFSFWYRAINSIKNCEKPLNSIQEQLKNALFLSQQIKYEHTRRLVLRHNNNACI